MHAIAALSYKNLNPEDYVHPYYSMETYHKLYKHHIQPVAGQEYWTKSDNPTIGPPPFKRPAGRPKKLRKKTNDVNENPYKGKRKFGKVQCSKCKGMGHNARACKGVAPKQKKRKQKAQNNEQVEVTNEALGSQGPPIASQPSQQQQVSNSSRSIAIATFRPPRPYAQKEPQQFQVVSNIPGQIRRLHITLEDGHVSLGRP